MTAGSKVKAVWIAEKTKVAPPGYKIDTVVLDVGTQNKATFALSRPRQGWPVGDYRVELFIDDKLLNTVKFSVKE